MTVKRILIIAPTLIIIFLLQSYLWVPTYEEQTKGNPERMNQYITASIGDASLLNPILSADASSSQIETLVFEGLIDRDEELRFRGRLATSWEIFEEAFFYVNQSQQIPGLAGATGEDVIESINNARGRVDSLTPELASTLANIKEISLLPSRESAHTVKTDDKEKPAITIRVREPARIMLTLNKVDQDLFKNLSLLLGRDYFSSFDGVRYLYADDKVDKETLKKYAAELLPATEHNPVIVFHLRPDVRFHDGHTFDAEDVRFTYEAIMDPRNLSPRVSDYESVKSVQVLDPLTVRIVYKRLYSPAIGTWAMGILPEHLLNSDSLKQEALRLGKDPSDYSIRQSGFNRHPVGCGPFVFRQWKSDQYIRLDRFDDYWEGPPNYRTYLFRIIPDLLTQEMEFYAGTVDDYNVQPHQVDRLREDKRYQNFSGTSFGYTYIGYNIRREPFDDPRVRKALGMAIDVDKIISYVLYGQGERITGPFVKESDYYNQAIAPLPYDPQGALRLLEEAGWKRNKEGLLEKDGKSLRFTLITNSGNDLRKAVLAIAQEAWKQIGIAVNTDLLEWSVFIQERVNKSDFDALILGWNMGIDPDLYQIWHSSQTNPHQLNFVGFKNQEADDLIIRIRQEYDNQTQVKYCHRLHEIIADEQPYTFLYVSRWTAILDRRIVIMDKDDRGEAVYKKIKPTKTGNYTFYFNKWIKLREVPSFSPEG
ncbi:putative oligopeptide ABC transporter, oligopeptide-binding protein AppA [uncultured Desulfobacterium sp.]|uniref:Putative oligopeptide ABC transporter, oligopeptide-binding protein AppA n=1 Tax=uncultured Desulfobacterium sp. TaxID=201089 RepID=A0A445N3S8_9BACT|nr:putative oligopeptide ABC transporter, oligopeptide-binding protein AppA [uncultured Desulfobacterium sp.]